MANRNYGYEQQRQNGRWEWRFENQYGELCCGYADTEDEAREARMLAVAADDWECGGCGGQIDPEITICRNCT